LTPLLELASDELARVADSEVARELIHTVKVANIRTTAAMVLLGRIVSTDRFDREVRVLAALQISQTLDSQGHPPKERLFGKDFGSADLLGVPPGQDFESKLRMRERVFLTTLAFGGIGKDAARRYLQRNPMQLADLEAIVRFVENVRKIEGPDAVQLEHWVAFTLESYLHFPPRSPDAAWFFPDYSRVTSGEETPESMFHLVSLLVELGAQESRETIRVASRSRFGAARAGFVAGQLRHRSWSSLRNPLMELAEVLQAEGDPEVFRRAWGVLLDLPAEAPHKEGRVTLVFWAALSNGRLSGKQKKALLEFFLAQSAGRKQPEVLSALLYCREHSPGEREMAGMFSGSPKAKQSLETLLRVEGIPPESRPELDAFNRKIRVTRPADRELLERMLGAKTGAGQLAAARELRATLPPQGTDYLDLESLLPPAASDYVVERLIQFERVVFAAYLRGAIDDIGLREYLTTEILPVTAMDNMFDFVVSLRRPGFSQNVPEELLVSYIDSRIHSAPSDVAAMIPYPDFLGLASVEEQQQGIRMEGKLHADLAIETISQGAFEEDRVIRRVSFDAVVGTPLWAEHPSLPSTLTSAVVRESDPEVLQGAWETFLSLPEEAPQWEDRRTSFTFGVVASEVLSAGAKAGLLEQMIAAARTAERPEILIDLATAERLSQGEPVPPGEVRETLALVARESAGLVRVLGEWLGEPEIRLSPKNRKWLAGVLLGVAGDWNAASEAVVEARRHLPRLVEVEALTKEQVLAAIPKEVRFVEGRAVYQAPDAVHEEIRFPCRPERLLEYEDAFRRYFLMAGYSEPLERAIRYVAALPHAESDLGAIPALAERALLAQNTPSDVGYQLAMAIGHGEERSPSAIRLLSALVREGKGTEVRWAAATVLRKGKALPPDKATLFPSSDRTPSREGFRGVLFAAYACGVIPERTLATFLRFEDQPGRGDPSLGEMERLIRFLAPIRGVSAKNEVVSRLLGPIASGEGKLPVEEVTERMRLLGQIPTVFARKKLRGGLSSDRPEVLEGALVGSMQSVRFWGAEEAIALRKAVFEGEEVRFESAWNATAPLADQREKERRRIWLIETMIASELSPAEKKWHLTRTWEALSEGDRQWLADHLDSPAGTATGIELRKLLQGKTSRGGPLKGVIRAIHENPGKPPLPTTRSRIPKLPRKGIRR
jgi:hypothetical protein